MIASFKPGDHGFCHVHALGKLLLRLAGVLAQFEKPLRALSGEGCTVVENFDWVRLSMRALH